LAAQTAELLNTHAEEYNKVSSWSTTNTIQHNKVVSKM